MFKYEEKATLLVKTQILKDLMSERLNHAHINTRRDSETQRVKDSGTQIAM